MKNNKPVELIEEMTIKIFQSSNGGGYCYSIYDTVDNIDNALEIDGGLCTSDLTNALEMATDQAIVLASVNRDLCYEQDLKEFNSLSEQDKMEVQQRMDDMRDADANDDESWDGTDAQYLHWALEEFWANKEEDEIVKESVDKVVDSLNLDEEVQQKEYKNL